MPTDRKRKPPGAENRGNPQGRKKTGRRNARSARFRSAMIDPVSPMGPPAPRARSGLPEPQGQLEPQEPSAQSEPSLQQALPERREPSVPQELSLQREQPELPGRQQEPSALLVQQGPLSQQERLARPLVRLALSSLQPVRQVRRGSSQRPAPQALSPLRALAGSWARPSCSICR